MKEFSELFRRAYAGNATVQDGDELSHIFDLMKSCSSYLEIGTAEGGSLSVLSYALKSPDKITCVDQDQNAVGKARKNRLKELKEDGIIVKEIIGNCHKHETIKQVRATGQYDCVMIDAGHKYHNVIADAMIYGELAKKYIFFHDICLEDVSNAFDWYVKQQGLQSYKFIRDENYGYGVVKL